MECAVVSYAYHRVMYIPCTHNYSIMRLLYDIILLCIINLKHEVVKGMHIHCDYLLPITTPCLCIQHRKYKLLSFIEHIISLMVSPSKLKPATALHRQLKTYSLVKHFHRAPV